MKHLNALPLGGLSLVLLVLPVTDLNAQTFVGTNAPGQATNFTFNLSGSGTNLSLVVSNNATAYSYLRLAKGRAPTETDFDFVARLNGATNRIDLESRSSPRPITGCG